MNELTITNTDLTTIPLDHNPAAVYIASLGSKHSREAMINALNKITDLLYLGRFQKPEKNASPEERQLYRQRFLLSKWADLRAEHTKAIRAQLAEKYSPATVNQALAALRGVLSQAEDLNQIGADDMRKATKIKAVKGETLPAGRELTMGEILALAQACRADKSPLGARDAAVIGVLYTCGLRRAELVALELADFDPATGKLTIQSGKGRKARELYASNGGLAALTAWIEIRGQESGPLFLEIRKGGHIQHGASLTAQAVYNLLKERGEQAHVKKFSPHDFRRTFISQLLAKGVDIATVAKMAGHANVNTTARYDRRPDEAKKKAAELLHFPY